jgi:hypothetical protein
MTKHWILYSLLILAVLGVGLCWLRAHDAYRDAVADNKLLKVYMGQKDAEISAAHNAEKKALADFEGARNKPATVQTITKYLPSPLPAGSAISIVPTSQGNALQLSGDATTNLKYLQNMELDCQECKASLLARTAEFNALQDKFKAKEKEASDWQSAAKTGHGFWDNLKHDVLVGGISFGIGYGLRTVTHK